VGMLVLGANLYLIGPSMSFSPDFINIAGLVSFIFGLVLILFFTIVVMYNAYVREDISIDHINFSWFITPVANIIIPILGSPRPLLEF